MLAEFAAVVTGFRTCAEADPLLTEACAEHPGLATCHRLGESEEGRPLLGIVLGRGPTAVSLIAGAHADEPVGPETLRTLVLETLRRHDPILDRFRFVLVPHVNPDGEARNRPWIQHWPDPSAWLRDAVREPPGRDLEFGFPGMRVENRLVAEFLRPHAPFALHMSLHGMAVAEGAQLLIERTWADRTRPLRAGFAAACRARGMGLHDHDRGGEKGFHYLGPGFMTTPEGEGMRHYFLERGDERTAGCFHQSSMEFVRSLGGDPLCLVTEVPLFLLRNRYPAPGRPTAWLALRERLPALVQRAREGARLHLELSTLGLRAVPLDRAVALQLEALDLGLATARG